MKKTIEVQLKEIHEKVDSYHKKKDWYCKLGKIVNVYEKTMVPHWFEGKYFLRTEEGNITEYEVFTGTKLSVFEPTTEEELSKIIKESGIKTSPEDPVPAKILQSIIDEALPTLKELVNKSM